MITKIYEVTCDYCGVCLNHYIGKKPTMEELRDDGFVIAGAKVFCGECCCSNWQHDMLEKRYINLKQNGRIHNNG